MKLFKKPRSKFYWYDFTVRGRRYRASTQETKSVKALRIASLKLALVIQNTDPLPTKPTALRDFAERFTAWVDTARLEEMTSKFYRNGWRLLKATPVVEVRVNQITGDCAEQLKFPGSAANANCALRRLQSKKTESVVFGAVAPRMHYVVPAVCSSYEVELVEVMSSRVDCQTLTPSPASRAQTLSTPYTPKLQSVCLPLICEEEDERRRK